MINLGSAARFVREKLGLTQVDAARQVGISNVHLCNIESGKVNPSPDIIERYFANWGVDLHMIAVTMFSDEDRVPAAVRPSLKKLRTTWAVEIEKKLKTHTKSS